MSRSSAAIKGRRIAVVGAGIGGLALAARLARLGHSPVIFESRSEAAAVSEGIFLTLAPNGMNGLRLIDVDAAVEAAGIDTTGIEIRNSSGKRLNLADQRDHKAVFGAPSITLGRGMLAALLLERARQAGAEVHFDAAVAAVDARSGGVTVRLAGSSTFDAEIVVAADGLRSTVRGLIYPDYPQPVYTGLIGTGGAVEADIEPTGGVMRMTFGDLAFFGYIRPAGGLVYWFNSYPAEAVESGRIADPGSYARRIGALHARDPEPNARILAVVGQLERNYPVYDMPTLPAWHRGRVVLMGDAAHAIGPHTGQGASMAIEDAMILAACLDVEVAPEIAFARYEAIRRRRVEQVVMLTRRLGSQKRASSWLRVMIRDFLLPLVIPLGIKAGRKLFAYRVDRDPVVCPANKRENGA